MRRRYSVAEYERAVLLAQEMIPGGAITTDILVGFPGESEEEFAESYNFCHRIGFAGIHVFPYSARCGTVAATLPFQVEERVKRARKEKMLQLAQRLAQSFRRRFLGQTVMVLWEKRNEPGIWSGLSDNYLRVLTRYQGDLTNRLLPARLIGEHKQGLWGEIVEEEKYG
jgi:threonylcarbamoyladenosine tRNA methylthiotransferase MtaB